MERRLVALILIAAGIWIEWGPGFALMAAGVGLLIAQVEGRPLVVRARRGAVSLGGLLRAAPRRATAAGLVGLAAVMLPLAGLLALGLWAALGVAGAIVGAAGAVLGWE